MFWAGKRTKHVELQKSQDNKLENCCIWLVMYLNEKLCLLPMLMCISF